MFCSILFFFSIADEKERVELLVDEKGDELLVDEKERLRRSSTRTETAPEIEGDEVFERERSCCFLSSRATGS